MFPRSGALGAEWLQTRKGWEGGRERGNPEIWDPEFWRSSFASGNNFKFRALTLGNGSPSSRVYTARFHEESAHLCAGVDPAAC